MLFSDLNGRVDEFGGFDGSLYQSTMYQWSGSDWQRLHPATVPYARSSAAVGVNRVANQIVMFGGLGDVNPFNTWTYNGTTWTMESPATQPPLVYAGSAVFDRNLNAVLLFGGGNGGSGENSTWSWDVRIGTSSFPRPHPARAKAQVSPTTQPCAIRSFRWATRKPSSQGYLGIPALA